MNSEAPFQNGVVSLNWWRKAADQGDAEAALEVGTSYLTGADTVKNLQLAELYLIDAADLGNVEALCQLGNLFLISDDLVQSVGFYETAANEGHHAAMFELAKMHFKPHKDVVDAANAEEWLREAATAGHSDAQLLLGLLLHEGSIEARPSETAAKWVGLSAFGGNQRAKRQLIELFARKN